MGIVEGIVAALILWRILVYRQWQLDVTGASGRTYTLFRANRDTFEKHSFEIIYWADGFSVEERDVAESDLVRWGAPFATARGCTQIEVCAATNVRATRFGRFYRSRSATFTRRADGSWSKEGR